MSPIVGSWTNAIASSSSEMTVSPFSSATSGLGGSVRIRPLTDVRTTVAGARSDCSRSSLRRRLRRRWSCERGDLIREFVGVEPLRVDGRETTDTADPEQLNRLVRREPSMRTLACAIDVSVVPSRERRRDRIAANCGCRRIGRSVTSPVVASRSGGSMSVSSPRQRPATVRPRSSSSQ